jgi:cold shock CspA family protein
VLRPAGGPEPVWGHLVDIANRGFRARHKARGLEPGQQVEFEIAGFPGRARVVWTRIVGERVESGFLILAEGEE